MFIGFYWSKRQQSREACGQILCEVLREMAATSDVFASWYVKGKSKKSSFEPIDLSSDALAASLKSNRNDVDASEIAELGFAASLWNGNDEFSVSIGATLGGYSEYVKNSLVVQLPSRSKVEGQLSSEALRILFTRLTDRIRPDDAAITSNSYLDEHGAMPWEAGWLVYNSQDGSVEERESMAVL
jgi:hypothetical protein